MSTKDIDIKVETKELPLTNERLARIAELERKHFKGHGKEKQG